MVEGDTLHQLYSTLAAGGVVRQPMPVVSSAAFSRGNYTQAALIAHNGSTRKLSILLSAGPRSAINVEVGLTVAVEYEQISTPST